MNSSGELLRISEDRLKEINDFLTDPANPLVRDLTDLLDKYGGVEEIRRKARENGSYESLMGRLGEKSPEMAAEVEWLAAQRDAKAFIDMEEYRKNVLGDRYGQLNFDDSLAVTLEISACQYFRFLMAQCRQAIERRELVPGRLIRVRNMKEQEEDGDLLAFTAAMHVLGSSWCETLDTRGTDGSNVHLGGPETITGYFGGVGQPNEHVVQWLDEYLYYHTNYGTKQVLNINGGSILGAYMLHRLGVDMEFKISVYMGNDNPYSVFWTLLTAKLFSRDDGTTSLIGFNYANSVNNDTIRMSSRIREALGFRDIVRFEHHIFETYKSIVVQPYDRRAELLEVAGEVPNIAAKHEGGEPAVEQTREHPSDILDYFGARRDFEEQGLMDAIEQNYLDKHASLNGTARALTEKGLSVIAAPKLHNCCAR